MHGNIQISLQMSKLKDAALGHVDEWIRKLGDTWLSGTQEKLEWLEQLIKKRHLSTDGSISIDISLLIIEIEESWYRLGHYSIHVREIALNSILNVNYHFKY